MHVVYTFCMERLFAARMDLPETAWQAALEKQVPAKFLEMNRRAFALGQAQKEE